MSNVFDNPWRHSVHLAAGSAQRQQRRAALKSLRASFQNSFGKDWHDNETHRIAYEAQAADKNILTGRALGEKLRSLKTQYPKDSPERKAQQVAAKARRKVQHAFANDLSTIPKEIADRKQGGKVLTWSKTHAGHFTWGKKRMQKLNADGSVYLREYQVPIMKKGKGNKGVFTGKFKTVKVPTIVPDVKRITKYNVARGGRRALSGFDREKGWQPGQQKAMARLIAGLEDGSHKPLFPYDEYPVAFGSYFTGSERRAKASKAATTRKEKAPGTLFGGAEGQAASAAYNALSPAKKKAYSAAKKAGASKAELAALRGARNNPGIFGALALDNYGGIALDNFGALALDNYGGIALDNYGGLALSNPLPFGVGVVAISTGKVILTGLAGAALHAVVGSKIEEYLPKIPMGDKLLALEVPESIPVIGGMGLVNTVTGIIGGLAVILGSQYLGRKFAVQGLAEYGSAVGGGILIAGPILDYAAKRSNDIGALSADDLAGLAIDNYGDLGALSEDQYAGVGVFGDGMAYELGPIVSDDEYGQASLGDAYYSGADFDVDEGDSIVRGRGQFQGKYGTAPQRIEQHGGRQEGSASHLAGRPGHRWGWLIKMIGWKNVEKLAKMSPEVRVRAIKQLRDSAMATFKQISQQSQVQSLAPSEFAPAVSGGASDGVHGASSSFGSTIFGGQGM